MSHIIITLTDTIYGILAPALDQSSVLRVYEIKKRAPEKPCIILISNIAELQKFGIYLDTKKGKQLSEMWESERPTSIILDIPKTHAEQFTYLHRGTNTLAFRIPKQGIELLELLQHYGPMIAPSANPEGYPPAQNLDQAKNYFSEHSDILYQEIDRQPLENPSRVIRLYNNGNIETIRP
jgi:L-threonylcarbamoyladenylate synthase